ncbi:type II secretion system protein GspC [Pseudidiomarina aestuarii]|uniref:Type II secretion system protein GspC n=1 Tax=Pseudidiomarina aestuarii TaxID=624146 RepID=A0A2T4CTQ9_9GAMM|nr:type II secretion system protein GspC [Pseudidiomarina aestuarii]PTB89285.1 type II secretion system protein GspC [Pseudidiomarina aestuarii]PTB89542.1 type II secretion system protein GspC [Pseudidiomarina aestuarii]
MQKLLDNPVWWARGLWTLTAICAIAAALFVAQLTWQFLTPPAAPEAGPLPPAQVQSRARVDVAGINRLNLFGSTATVQQASTNAPKTQLNVRLMGVSAASAPERSAAIIEQRGTQEVYAVGEKLTGTQVTVHEIYADRVILDNNGRLETLELEGIGELSEGLSLTMENSRERAAASSAEQGRPPINRRAATQLSRDQVQQARQAGSAGILNYIRFSPVQESGGISGFRLNPGPQPELFNEAGFQAGDIAVAINGENLTDASTAMRMTSELGNMQQVTVTVLRNNEYIDLELSVPTEQ